MKKSGLLPMNLQFFSNSGGGDGEFTDTGVKEQGPAAPGSEGGELPGDEDEDELLEDEGGSESDPEPEEGQQQQSEDENAKYAAIRRKAEEQARAKASAELNREVERVFGSHVSPVTGQPIRTWEEYLQAVEAQNKEIRDNELRSKGIDPAIIDAAVNNSPALRQANEIIAQTVQTEAARRLSADIQTISKMDGTIKSEEDLQKHESFPEVFRLVRENGLNLVDAFRLANYNSLVSQQTGAVKQAAINQAKSKSHLETTKQAGGEDNLQDIPANELPVWREVYPGLSESELKKKYNAIL